MGFTNTTMGYNDYAMNVSVEQLNFNNVQHYCETIIHPVIFTIGVTGNVVNLVVFTRQRMRHGKSDIEKAATTGLMFLAVSDMMYCVIGLMTHFLVPFPGVLLYYQLYKTALLNTFQFSSTWQTVTVAVERYMAVTHPFKARQTASSARTTVLCVLVFVISIVFNVPFIFEYGVELNGDNYVRAPGPLDLGDTAKHAYTIVWSVFGNVIPLLTLAFCNVRFLVVIYHSQDRFTPRGNGDPARRNPLLNSTTVTFALIICFFFLLVCPAMVVRFIGNSVARFSHKAYYRFQLTLIITNTMLAVNFAVNFLLYCYALRDFRKTLTNMPRCASLLHLRSSAQTPTDKRDGKMEPTVTAATDLIQYHSVDTQDTSRLELTAGNSRTNEVSSDSCDV